LFLLRSKLLILRAMLFDLAANAIQLLLLLVDFVALGLRHRDHRGQRGGHHRREQDPAERSHHRIRR
jgi:hypothetical protein